MKPEWILSSPETGTDYSIYIEKPSGGKFPGPCPAVLFMDGDDQFQAAVAAYRAARIANTVMPLLLVGVGYGASYRNPANRRGRDYTPVAHSDEPSSGGANAFLRFLTHTLWPELERRFPLDATSRGLAGHSLGALLVLHALFQRAPFFTHHLASAPSIWWADRNILQQVEKRWATQSALPARLYLSIGTEDSASMTADLDLLERQLSAVPFSGLAVRSQRFPGLNHFNLLPAAFGAGLTALWPVEKN